MPDTKGTATATLGAPLSIYDVQVGDSVRLPREIHNDPVAVFYTEPVTPTDVLVDALGAVRVEVADGVVIELSPQLAALPALLVHRPEREPAAQPAWAREATDRMLAMGLGVQR